MFLTLFNSRGSSQELYDLRKKVKDSGSMKLRDGYDRARVGVEWMYSELTRLLQLVSKWL